MRPLVSVILPVYNQENFIAETIESVLSQTFRDFEFLILDDGSTDKSAEIIRSYAAKDNRVKAFFEKNQGKSNATNQIVESAQGEFCAFLDADDVMLPGRLAAQVEFHNANPGIHASSAHCYYINEKGNQFGIQRYPSLRTVEEWKNASDKKEWITCSFTALMVTTDAYKKTGGLMKRFEPCEDFEFLNRLVDQKFIILINPVVLMKYRIHPTAVTVKKPMLIFDTITFVKHCIELRRQGKPEITFAEFTGLQKDYSWWVKFNRKRFNYSRIFFRSAGFAILSKNYMSFVWQIATSMVLSPDYVFKKMTNLSKK
ncbi:MAG: glycosyltransferase [Bacteroidota bacterium]|nr:glycosyltransferase [Ferruginibacter sp.]